MKNVKKYVMDGEHEEIHKLVVSLSELCDTKIPMLIKKLRLKNLKKFKITVEGLSLGFTCDDEVYDEIVARIREGEDQKLDYFG